MYQSVAPPQTKNNLNFVENPRAHTTKRTEGQARRKTTPDWVVHHWLPRWLKRYHQIGVVGGS